MTRGEFLSVFLGIILALMIGADKLGKKEKSLEDMIAENPDSFLMMSRRPECEPINLNNRYFIIDTSKVVEDEDGTIISLGGADNLIKLEYE